MTECAICGVGPADLPYEELGLDIDEAADLLFDQVDGQTYCQGCAEAARTLQREPGPDSWQWLGTDR